ncbi:MAG: NAD(P)-dependent oxidoreductase [Hyphomicrobiales bacterium]|nr:MAG: NAD(P)-dependent oxidoreductase [Hyphomicrobiales bacterium]
MSESKTVFIFGLGYSASYAAQRLATDGFEIVGTSRSSDGGAQIAARGWQSLLFDGIFREEIAQHMRRADHILISIAPDVAGADPGAPYGGDPVLSVFANTFKDLPKKPWLGYLSTVGVYGHHEGAWVDETSACYPVSKRSLARLAAENAWRDLAAEIGSPLGVFRLSGIYGFGRNPLEKVARGEGRRINKPGQVFNRIHVQDIASALVLAVQQRADGLFNITDDEPAPPQDVVKYAAELLKMPVPPLIPFDECDLSPMGRSFYGENKRVSNQKSKEQLGLSYAMPTYREGMKRALLDVQNKLA